VAAGAATRECGVAAFRSRRRLLQLRKGAEVASGKDGACCNVELGEIPPVARSPRWQCWRMAPSTAASISAAPDIDVVDLLQRAAGPHADMLDGDNRS
jgi:hypothetical protein